MEETVRERFFDEIEDAVGRYGGFISLFDTIDLQLARKPLQNDLRRFARASGV